jgi:hypothetical protein
MDIKLTVNNVEIRVGIEFTSNIINYLNDDESNQEIFHELAQHPSASVRKEVAYKDKISEETARILLEDTDPSVLVYILKNKSTKEILTEDDFKRILETKNEELIQEIINNIDDYSLISDADQCLASIIALDNDYLTLKIADSYSTPKKILKKLIKHSDPDIILAAKNSLE